MQPLIDLSIEQGREQGERNCEAKWLLRQMERTFGPTDARLRQQIQAAEAETLLAWSERILTAETRRRCSIAPCRQPKPNR